LSRTPLTPGADETFFYPLGQGRNFQVGVPGGYGESSLFEYRSFYTPAVFTIRISRIKVG